MTTTTLVSPRQHPAPHEGRENILEYSRGRVGEKDMDYQRGIIQGRVVVAATVRSREVGMALSASCAPGFWLMADDVLRRPDVSLSRPRRIAAMKKERGALQGCPDIAVEVIADAEQAGPIETRTREYLDSGAAAVWNVYPQSESVTVRRANGDHFVVQRGGVLEEPSVFAGLQIPVGEFFD